MLVIVKSYFPIQLELVVNKLFVLDAGEMILLKMIQLGDKGLIFTQN